jgi:multidrug efflux pump subunit AcrA (membrane-fusion protein)
MSQVAPWLDHFSSCSPCFREFNAFRRQVSRRRRTRVLVAAAVALIVVLAGWLFQRTRASVPTTDTALLDLRERSVTRGIDPIEAAVPPLEIVRNVRHLVLDLPIGSKEGSYEVALLNDAGDEVERATGAAQFEDHVVVLRADVHLARVRLGYYFLALRQPGREWTKFAAHVP